MTQQTIADLQTRFRELKAAESRIKVDLAAVNEMLAAHVSATARDLYRNANKQSGDVAIIEDGVKVKCSISKKVEWDTDKLLPVMQSMNYDRATQLFDIKVSMPEKIYTALTDDTLKAAVDAARVVKYGEMKIEFAGEK